VLSKIEGIRFVLFDERDVVRPPSSSRSSPRTRRSTCEREAATQNAAASQGRPSGPAGARRRRPDRRPADPPAVSR
jgi:hypothetical protein